MSQTMPRDIGNELDAPTARFLFEELYATAHDHMVRATFPASNEGTPRDLVIVDTGSAVYICVKTARGWFKTAALATV